MRDLASHPGARGLLDDAAVWEPGGGTLVLTHDTLVEGVHVLPGQDPADVAWKLVAVNLSDLAAKGAVPVGLLLSHIMGEGDGRFLNGLSEVLRRFGVPLLGGDTVAAPGRRVWGCTAIGRAAHVPVPSRSGARPGDGVFVTGPLGAAMLGFEALRDGTGAQTHAYRRPTPRLREGQQLAPHVSAMMDVSDGLLLDAWRMAQASGVTLELERSLIPVACPSRIDECLRWGDDYELLFTAPAGATPPVEAYRIGKVVARANGPVLLDGAVLTKSDRLGYRHGAPAP